MATRLKRLAKAGMALAITSGVIACEGDRTIASPAEEPSASQADKPRDNLADAAADRVGDPATPALSESDVINLEIAQSACRDQDPVALFMAYTGSRAVRERYTASNVTVGQTGKSRKISRQRYLEMDQYPVARMDYFYVTSDAAKKFEAAGGDPDELRYVQLEIDQASDRRVVVEWLPGIFEKDLDPPPPDLEDGLGKLIQETGSGGRLLFFPTDHCWELVGDLKNPPLQL